MNAHMDYTLKHTRNYTNTTHDIIITIPHVLSPSVAFL